MAAQLKATHDDGKQTLALAQSISDDSSQIPALGQSIDKTSCDNEIGIGQVLTQLEQGH